MATTIIQREVLPSSTTITYNLNSVPEAVDIIVSILHRACYRNIARHRLNDGKHWIITALSPKTGMEEIFYVKWEAALFKKAGIYVPELTGTKGAVTINTEYAIKAEQLGAMILFAQKDHGVIYGILAFDFMKNSYPHLQLVSGEQVRCIGIESVDPWILPYQIRRDREAFLENSRKKLQNALNLRDTQEKEEQEEKTETKPQETEAQDMNKKLLLLRCEDCGYMAIQTKQDKKAVEMQENRDRHIRTFGHVLKFEWVSRTNPLALELREKLNRWERW